MNILILGATSAIARAVAAQFAARGDTLYLASRDTEELARIATHLTIRYNVPVYYDFFDAEALSCQATFWQSVLAQMGQVDGIFLAFGYMPDNQVARNMPVLEKTILNNFTAAAAFLSYCADYFEQQKSGFIIGLTSVAGDRGRQSNYIYGAAKAAFTVYLQGLRNRLSMYQVKVLTIKLGFVDTAMTFGLPKLFLVAKPEIIANQIIRALAQNREVAYLPWFWRYIMLIIRLVPEKIFKKLSL